MIRSAFLVLAFLAATPAPAQLLPTDPASPVHPRKFGIADHRVETIRGWYVWKKWNPDTWEAEVTKDPPGEVYHVRVLPWATTYRHLVYGARPDDLLPGERVNLFFAADERHPRGYVVHFQDELCQMKGHGHVWEIRSSTPEGFTARVMAKDKPLDDKELPFRLEPTCKVWRDGKTTTGVKVGERVYLTWCWRDEQRHVSLVADDASLPLIKKQMQDRVAREVAKEGVGGQVEKVDGHTIRYMAFATSWSQVGELKPGQEFKLSRVTKGYRPYGPTVLAKLVSRKNRGSYGSGVSDMVLEAATPADAAVAAEWTRETVVRLIPSATVDLGTVTEKHVMIPMRDGVRLSTYLYVPEGKGPWPVIYEQRYADLRGAETRKGYARLAAAGFVVAAQSFRGAQLSEGTWVGYRALGWGEKKDGYDTVEWLASQPWSTGNVGSVGSSQGGFAQNFLAVAAPLHLKCQYMIDTGLSLFHEGYRIGGATRPERFKQMDAVCRHFVDNRKLLDEWFAHPTYDAYWADEDCTRYFEKMNVPCFTVGSWFDFMCQGSIASYVGRQHAGGPKSRGQQQLIVGPWLHGRFKETNKANELVFPEDAKFAMEAHMIRWFDHYLKGVENGVEREPAVKYYVMGPVGEKDASGNVWRTANDWPVPAQSTSYFLRGGGKLSPIASDEAQSSTTFRADPLHPNEIPGRAFPGAKNARDFEKQAEVRTFTSEVLTQPIEWTGQVKAELYVSSSAPDTDFIVRVSDVYPDGRSLLMIDYVRRARYRDGFDKEVMMLPNQVYKVAFDVGWISQMFAKGHRIRVTVSSTGAPFYEPNPNTGEPLTTDWPAKSAVAQNVVYHDRLHGSRIIAPVAGK
jgi:predicted acyl esterase